MREFNGSRYYNLDEDKKELFGENYKEIDKERICLFEEVEGYYFQVRGSNSIIQNPVPIKEEELEEWKARNEEFIKEYKETLRKIEDFVRKNHIK